MAKSKRASLKDKGPESLGLAPKKNKGIDLLFGGAVNKDSIDSDVQLDGEMENNDMPDDTRVGGTSDIAPEPSETDERLVDELGLPVALEAPPDDLILASDPLTSPTEDISFDAASSPFVFPQAEVTLDSDTDDANDLSGIVEDNNNTILEGENLSSSEEKENLSGIVEDTGSDESDLSALAAEANDLSGLVTSSPVAEVEASVGVEPAVESVNDLSGLVEETQASVPSYSPPPPPPTPEVGTAAYTPPTYAYTPPPAPAAAPVGPAAGASPYQGVTIDAAPAGVVNALSTFAETVPITRDSFKPQDEFAEVGDHTLSVTEYQAAEKDAALAEKILNYVGSERRDKLFDEVERLYTAVAKDLSGSKTDANFALDTLRQAHNLILEDPREYDEAYYRVAIVKTMLDRKSNLQRWSYTWGLFVLFYGIAWLVLCMFGYFLPIDMSQLQGETVTSVALQAWFSGLAGGIGGAVAILWTLYYRVSVKQDFDRQYLMWYMVKPILGFVLGLVMYFLLIAASSLFGSTDATAPGFDSATGIALAIFFGFVAGFRQDNVYDWIYVIIKAISPKASAESQSKTPVVPYELPEESKSQ